MHGLAVGCDRAWSNPPTNAQQGATATGWTTPPTLKAVVGRRRQIIESGRYNNSQLFRRRALAMLKLSRKETTMRLQSNLVVLAALCCLGASSPAGAQTVYRCGSNSVTYSDVNCSGRVVNTDNAPVQQKSADVRKKERDQALAQAMRPQPGESTEQFEVRRHRVGLRPEDRAECARLDKRMPVEAASRTNPDPEEVAKAEEALAKSKQQFSQLGC
jgi:hypothetical protein